MADDRYINGVNVPQWRKGRGDGTTLDPFRFGFFSTELETSIGAPADISATTDIGTFSLVSLLKRILASKLPDAVNSRIPVDPSYGTYGAPLLTVTSALATGAFFDTSRFGRVRLQVNNTGANPLNGFEISSFAHASGDAQVHLNTSAHFTSPTAGSIVRHCADLSGAPIDLTTLPAGGKAVMAIDLRDFFAMQLRLRATSTAGTTLQFYWGAA